MFLRNGFSGERERERERDREREMGNQMERETPNMAQAWHMLTAHRSLILQGPSKKKKKKKKSTSQRQRSWHFDKRGVSFQWLWKCWPKMPHWTAKLQLSQHNSNKFFQRIASCYVCFLQGRDKTVWSFVWTVRVLNPVPWKHTGSIVLFCHCSAIPLQIEDTKSIL